ncbi:MAG TPA: archaemetzincin [Thermoanaerobaculia bacterium]|nr:archaemetzincin [Thermoanaerobaculia bacterium]
MRPIHLVRLGNVDRALIDRVRLAVMREYRVACRLDAQQLDPAFAFHPERGQYHSTTIIQRLAAMDRAETVVGITQVDLFIPILTYVFGEAQMNGSSAVVSFHRFAQEFYGLPADPSLLAARLSKTVVHEIGHTAGLTHCDDYDCVMAASHSVEYLDLKGVSLCAACLASLHSSAAVR